MKIDRVCVRYGELRSTGYPQFANTRHEFEFSATLEAGDTAGDAQARLAALARREVRKAFGDAPDQLDIPF